MTTSSSSFLPPNRQKPQASPILFSLLPFASNLHFSVSKGLSLLLVFPFNPNTPKKPVSSPLPSPPAPPPPPPLDLPFSNPSLGGVALLLSSPFSRWMVREPKAAALGSCVTMMTVLPERASVCRMLRTSLADWESRLPVGSSATKQAGRSDERAGDGHSLFLPAGKLAREMM